MPSRRNYPVSSQNSESQSLLGSTNGTAQGAQSNEKRSFFIDRVVKPLVPRSKSTTAGRVRERVHEDIRDNTSRVEHEDTRGRSRSIQPLTPHIPDQMHSSRSQKDGRTSSVAPPPVSNPWAVSAHTFTVRHEHDYTTSCTVIQRSDAPQGQAGNNVDVQKMLSSLPATNAHGSGGESIGRRLRKIPSRVGLNVLAKSDKARSQKQRPPLPVDQPGWGPGAHGGTSGQSDARKGDYNGTSTSTRKRNPSYGPESRRGELEERFARTDREAKLVAKGKGPSRSENHGRTHPSSSSTRSHTHVHVDVDVNVKRDGVVESEEEMRRRTMERARDQPWRKEWYAKHS